MDGATGATTQLLNMGLPGIVILALALAVVFLFKKYGASQEARITDGKEAVKALEANTASLTTLSKQLDDARGAK